MNNSVKNVLEELIKYSIPIEELSKKLNSLKEDIEEDLVYLEEEKILTVLQRFIRGSLTNDQIENWANLIESNEGIKFNNITKEIIYELANPYLTFELNKDRAIYLINLLNKSIK